MKNILKITFIFAFSLIFINCSDDDRFEQDTESGWVDFNSSNLTTNVSISDIDCAGLTSPITQIEIPFQVNSATNTQGLTITYQLQAVSGTDPSLLVSSSGTTEVPANTLDGNIILDILPNVTYTGSSTFNISLTGSSRQNITIGLSDNSKPTVHTVNFNLYDLSGTFESTSVVVPAFGGATAPNFTATATPVNGNPNQWNLDTSWGTGFIAWATGNPGFDGILVYPSIIEINPATGAVTVIGNDSDDSFGDYDTGGSGTFDRCTGELIYSIDAGFFGGITVDVTMQLQ